MDEDYKIIKEILDKKRLEERKAIEEMDKKALENYVRKERKPKEKKKRIKKFIKKEKNKENNETAEDKMRKRYKRVAAALAVSVGINAVGIISDMSKRINEKFEEKDDIESAQILEDYQDYTDKNPEFKIIVGNQVINIGNEVIESKEELAQKDNRTQQISSKQELYRAYLKTIKLKVVEAYGMDLNECNNLKIKVHYDTRAKNIYCILGDNIKIGHDDISWKIKEEIDNALEIDRMKDEDFDAETCKKYIKKLMEFTEEKEFKVNKREKLTLQDKKEEQETKNQNEDEERG